MIGNNAIDFLWHIAIAAAQSCLDVNHRNVQLGGCQRTCQCRVRVAVDEQPIRFFVQQHFLHSLQHRPRLLAMRARTYLQIASRLGDFELIEENL